MNHRIQTNYLFLTAMVLTGQKTLADVTVNWAIWDTKSGKNYAVGTNTLKSKSVTRVAFVENCYAFFILVYDDNKTVARLESRHKKEMRPVPRYKKTVHNIESHCPSQTYSFSASSEPIVEKKKLFE